MDKIFTSSARTPGEIAIEVQRAASVLERLQCGEVATYDELNEACGRDVRGRAHYALHKARERLQREKRMVFEAVAKVGIKRLDDAGIVGHVDRKISGIRRAGKRCVARLGSVDYEHASRETQTAVNTRISVLGALTELTSTPTRKAITSQVSKAGALPIGEVLNILKGDKISSGT